MALRRTPADMTPKTAEDGIDSENNLRSAVVKLIYSVPCWLLRVTKAQSSQR